MCFHARTLRDVDAANLHVGGGYRRLRIPPLIFCSIHSSATRKSRRLRGESHVTCAHLAAASAAADVIHAGRPLIPAGVGGSAAEFPKCAAS
jgi:hypothetical protein